MSASRPYLLDEAGLQAALVCTWWDSPFPADRRRAITLWSNGNLYFADRPSPAAVWAPQEYLGVHDFASARRTALSARCRHERLAPASPLVTAYLERNGGPQ